MDDNKETKRELRGKILALLKALEDQHVDEKSHKDVYKVILQRVSEVRVEDPVTFLEAQYLRAKEPENHSDVEAVLLAFEDALHVYSKLNLDAIKDNTGTAARWFVDNKVKLFGMGDNYHRIDFAWWRPFEEVVSTLFEVLFLQSEKHEFDPAELQKEVEELSKTAKKLEVSKNVFRHILQQQGVAVEEPIVFLEAQYLRAKKPENYKKVQEILLAFEHALRVCSYLNPAAIGDKSSPAAKWILTHYRKFANVKLDKRGVLHVVDRQSWDELVKMMVELFTLLLRTEKS